MPQAESCRVSAMGICLCWLALVRSGFVVTSLEKFVFVSHLRKPKIRNKTSDFLKPITSQTLFIHMVLRPKHSWRSLWPSEAKAPLSRSQRGAAEEEWKRGNKDITLTISGWGKLGHGEREPGGRSSRPDAISLVLTGCVAKCLLCLYHQIMAKRVARVLLPKVAHDGLVAS